MTSHENKDIKGPHTINAPNVGSTRDLISQKKVYKGNRLHGTGHAFECLNVNVQPHLFFFCFSGHQS